MRGTLFKAKSKDDGKWVEGYYVKLRWPTEDFHGIIPENTEIYPGNVIDIIIEIDPNTICTTENDGWIPETERLPEEKKTVLVQWEKYDRYINITLTYLDVMWLDDAEEKVFKTINGVPNGKVIAWRPLPDPYHSERSNNHDGE